MSTTPPAVVEAGDFTYESSSLSAAEMIRTLKSDDPKADAPKEVKRDGKATKQPDPVSDAAATLGKEGAKAAAKARKQVAKEPEAEVEEKAPHKAKAKAEPDPEPTVEEDEDTYETPELKAAAAARVQKATRKEAEAKAEAKRQADRADRAERALDEARRARPAAEERPAAREAEPPAVDPQKPKLADFLAQHETYDAGLEAYEDARDEYRDRKQAERQREHARGARIHSAIDSFTGRITEASEADESFVERTADIAQALQPSFTLAQGQRPQQVHVLSDEIIKSEHGPGLMLHFAENPEDFERIKALPSREAILRAVSKIEARLEDAIAGNPPSDERPGSNPEFSKAKPPARPVAVSPRIANAEPGADSSLDDHIEFYNARDKEKRRRSA